MKNHPKQTITVLILCLVSSFSSFAGGLMVVSPENGRLFDNPHIRPPRPMPMPPNFSPFQLEIKSEKVQVEITQQMALTHIEQVFHNPSGSSLEGYFLFPAPVGAVISNFSMQVNGKEMQAELLDAQKARDIYENIVRQFRDPALLEYADRNLFKVRIFPILPNSDTRIKLSYSQTLPKDDATVEYVYPMNTQKYSARPINEVTIEVAMSNNTAFKNIYCPTHQTEIVRKSATNAHVGYEAKNLNSDSDFKLYYTTDANDIGASVLSYKRSNEDGFFFLSLNPGEEIPNYEQPEKDIVFVIDVSGSMAGEKMTKAKQALQFCIANLNKGDKFNIIRFSTEARPLYAQLQTANNEHIVEAKQFIDNLKPIGGTNIDEALQQALAMKTNANRPYIVAFITDGKPTIGTTNEDALVDIVKKNNHANTRIFTVGIGNDLNTYLLDKITELTRSYRTYITTDEDMELKLSSFYTKISSPVLTNLKITYSNNNDVYDVQPHDLPDLFKGSSVSVLGRYRNGGQLTLTLEGTMNGETKRYTYQAQLPKQELKYDFVPTLWASRQVGYLLDQIRLHGEDKELVDEVVRLAKQYGIVTPYTSYLIVEDEMVNLPPRPVPMPMPHPPRPMPHLTPNDDLYRKGAEEYKDMKSRDNAGSARASKEIQSLNRADNIAQSRVGQERLDYVDKEGKTQNAGAQYRNIQGRAIYQNNGVWVDSEVTKVKNQSAKRIKFGSNEYFDLLKNQPDSAQFLALGNQIQFVLNDVLYEVFE